MVNGWIKAKERKGLGTSIIYKKRQYFLEIFADSSSRDNSHNVIIYDSSQESYESALGKSIQVEYFDTKKEAINFTEKYMKSH